MVPRFLLMNLSKCKTFSPANQIARNNRNDEEPELFVYTICICLSSFLCFVSLKL